eukprot:1212485-Pyramimonas_sp.AAC.1
MRGRILFGSRALAWDFLAIHSGIALSAFPSLAVAGSLLEHSSKIAPLRWMFPEFTQAPRSRHCTQDSRSRLGIFHRLLQTA